MWIIEKLKVIITVRERPEKVSLSFSIGLFIGLSPFLGIHTLLAILIAPVLRLNIYATLSGVYVTNPWTLVPIYTFSTWVGTLIVGGNYLKEIEFRGLSILSLWKALKSLLLPFFVGSLLVASVASVLSYFLLLRFLKTLKGKNP